MRLNKNKRMRLNLQSMMKPKTSPKKMKLNFKDKSSTVFIKSKCFGKRLSQFLFDKNKMETERFKKERCVTCVTENSFKKDNKRSFSASTAKR